MATNFPIIPDSFIVHHSDDYAIRQKKKLDEERINRAERIHMRTFNDSPAIYSPIRESRAMT